ncbi:MAG TPA: glycine cleavage system aminomethyltransferase GcvT [Candidatus Limnocylindria bacterium]
MTTAAPRRTPLDAVHRALGARLIEFAGYEMPVRYASELEEHRAVRQAVGLFDLSHMGEIRLGGPDALTFVRRVVVSDPATLEPGQAQYSMLCASDGGVIDDVIVYRIDEGYLVVCNAANRDAVVGQLRSVAADGEESVSIEDESDATALIAPQGPRAAELLAGLTDVDLGALRNYRSAAGRVAGIPCLVARTGYTGEDGFELFCDAEDAVAVWEAVAAAGQPFGLRPCGLASRDTLRLEAGMPLYGNELGRDVNPYEANLGRVVKLDKGPFVGREALAEVAATGPRRRLIGLVMRDEGIARHAYPVVVGEGGDAADEVVGTVTSGSLSPTLGDRIAMAFVRADLAEAEDPLAVIIRDRHCRAERVKLPFYRRPRPAEESPT